MGWGTCALTHPDMMDELKWVSNIRDPELNDRAGMDEDEWKDHLAYVNALIKGKPKASRTYTSSELECLGLIGLYEKKVGL